MKLLTLGALATVAFIAQSSFASDIPASGSGWCLSFGCGNTDTNIVSNSYAGLDSGNTFHDWFAVNVPNVTITTASLTIWNDAFNHIDDPDSIFSLYAASGIDFDGLVSGDVLGAIGLAGVDTGVGHYVTVTLNPTAIAALNTAAGGSFLFGGAVGGFGASDDSSVNTAFGWTDGHPGAFLTINASTAPEPASWAMMLLGFGVVGYGLRRSMQTRRRI
ncbi:MAG TPA: PEPxxWA-CTERM sorting domain-containing protein [Sphingomonas sp.]|uniref:PEPxxWA-CTERM sorting domain-containing protein n=1 Tax=Sphingomonas sp. TaxID=28214 RepID=UPI002C1B1772|nr:PEPxxWA-CTERM sorting domain-containing protein [Sphingomonas sp.]HMI20309.1 PEPxxWA-CTERM sorting domain-containing protein [Sphingomonas sp.]